MNKIIIKSEQGRTSIILNGMEMKNVLDFSVTQDANAIRGGCPIISIKMLVPDMELETE